MKTSVLWIEDNAYSDLQNVLGPVIVDGKYDLVIAENASEGIQRIMDREFEALIVDVRLPPGDGEDWIKLFYDCASKRINAQLGLEILRSLLRPESARIKHQRIPSWVEAGRFAVFTVESWEEVRETLEELKVPVYQEKNAQTSKREILNILDRLKVKERR